MLIEMLLTILLQLARNLEPFCEVLFIWALMSHVELLRDVNIERNFPKCG